MDVVRTEAFIDGRWTAAAAAFDVLDPAGGSSIAGVSDCGAGHAADAVAAAARALPAWSKLTAKARAAYLHRIKELMIQHRSHLATVLTRENGKPLKEAEGEVTFAASFFDWFAEEGRRCYGDHIPAPVDGKRLLTVREPVGVAALITPWNFPIAMLGRKAAPALAAGCTCVVKPAEDTPLSALLFAQICEEAGLPAGVVNVVPCSRENAPQVGSTLCRSPSVAAVSFTGSTAVGQLLYEQCGVGIKRLALELGGDAAFVVFESADLPLAIQGLMAAKFRNTGQTCVSANRILVQRSVFQQVVELLTKAMDEQLVVGPGLEASSTQGPLVNERQVRRVEALVADAVAAGARVVRGGRRHRRLGGLYYEPTLLVDVRLDMDVWRQEVFGPVAALMAFDDERQALDVANDTQRGLAGYVYTNDLRQAWRVAQAMDVGLLGVNDGLVSTCEAPFGGVKLSGFGKEGSRHGLDEFTNVKLISFGGLD